MKTLHEFHDMLTKALDAIDGANDAEDRAQAANAATSRTRALRDGMLAEAAKAKGEANAEVERLKKEAADLKAANDKEIANHKALVQRAQDAHKQATDAASETLEGINRQIAEGKAELEKLTTAKARIRAEIADALKNGE